jgi:hypothetical protein
MVIAVWLIGLGFGAGWLAKASASSGDDKDRAAVEAVRRRDQETIQSLTAANRQLTDAVTALKIQAASDQTQPSRPTPSTGNSEKPVTIDSVVEILREAGSSVERRSREAGDPWLDVVSQQVAWRVYFVSCAAQQCPAMTMQASFATSKKGPELFETADNWNATRRFSRAFSGLDGSATIASDIALAGASPNYLRDALVSWVEDLGEFRAFFPRQQLSPRKRWCSRLLSTKAASSGGMFNKAEAQLLVISRWSPIPKRMSG